MTAEQANTLIGIWGSLFGCLSGLVSLLASYSSRKKPRHLLATVALAVALGAAVAVTFLALWPAGRNLPSSPSGEVVSSTHPIESSPAEAGLTLSAESSEQSLPGVIAVSPGGQLVDHLFQHRPVQLLGVCRSASCVAIAADEHTFAAADDEGILHIWDLPGWKGPRRIDTAAGPLLALALSPNGRHLLTAHWDDGSLRLFEVRTGTEIAQFRGHHTQPVFCAAFAPGGDTAVTGGGDASLCVWDLTNQQSQQVLKGHRGTVKCVAFTASGRLLVSGGVDQTVRVWDARTGQMMHCLTGHSDEVSVVTASPDGQWILSGGADLTVRLWALDTEKERFKWKFQKPVQALHVSPDGRGILVVDKDTGVHPLEFIR